MIWPVTQLANGEAEEQDNLCDLLGSTEATEGDTIQYMAIKVRGVEPIWPCPKCRREIRSSRAQRS